MFERLKKTMPVRLLGDSVLNAKAKPVAKITPEIKDLAKCMIETMYKHDGIGLAAPQVGIGLRMFVLHVYPAEDENGNLLPVESPGEAELLPNMPMALINPEIIERSSDLEERSEGCLSVPGLYAPVLRPTRIVIRATLLDGREICLECAGLLARAMQHEYDHLDGIVFVQKIDDPSFEKLKPGMDKIIKKSGKRSFKIKRLKDA